VYHQNGSLMPMPDTDSKFLQIYFMDDEEQQINARCQYSYIEQMEEREIVGILEPFYRITISWSSCSIPFQTD